LGLDFAAEGTGRLQYFEEEVKVVVVAGAMILME